MASNEENSSSVQALMKDARDAAWLENKPKRAIRILREVIVRDSSVVDAQLEMAQIAYHLIPDRIDFAKTAIDSYLAACPDSVEGHLWNGHIQRKRHCIDDAIASLHKVLSIEPLHVRAIVCLGSTLFFDAGRHEEGLTLLEQSVEIAAAYGLSYLEAATRSILATAYDELEMRDKADEQWKIIVSLKPYWPVDPLFAKNVLERLNILH